MTRKTLQHSAQLDWIGQVPAEQANAPLTAWQTLQWLQLWMESGWLRRLDVALAAQLLRMDPQASPALLVATAVLAQMEGRGHTCLPLQQLLHPPAAWLAWPAPAVQGEQGLQALWTHMPATLAAWQQALQSSVLRQVDAPDQGQPLVLGGSEQDPLLYLRRYAAYEHRVGQGLRTRAPWHCVRPWL